MIQDFNTGFDMQFGMFKTMFFIVFLAMIGVMIFMLVKGISQWNANNKSPVLSVEAKVVSKRMDVTHNSHIDGMHNSSHTSYFVTFEVESKDRLELKVKDNVYGMLVEGDSGKLTFQGTRYHSFDRSL